MKQIAALLLRREFVFLALAILLCLRPVLRLMRFERVFANPPLAEAGIYVCILALLIVLV